MKLKRTALAAVAIAAAAVSITATVSANADEASGEFYVDPDSNAAAWLAANPDSPNADTIRTQIAEQAGAKWYGDWDTTPLNDYIAAAAQAGRTPIVVAYNMYQRDCGGESHGGADSKAEYQAWIDDFAADLGDSDAIVILEPDAVAQLISGCVGDPGTRRELLSYAVNSLATAPNARVYLDAGNAEWPGSPGDVASVLDAAGVSRIRGFAMNVSNHYTTEQSDTRAAQINEALNTAVHYVVDTSRNGSGKTQSGPDAWCNPPGATLGEHSVSTDGPADAHLWVKYPGDSDGDCGYGAGIPAGQFSEKLAMALITGNY